MNGSKRSLTAEEKRQIDLASQGMREAAKRALSTLVTRVKYDECAVPILVAYERRSASTPLPLSNGERIEAWKLINPSPPLPKLGVADTMQVRDQETLVGSDSHNRASVQPPRQTDSGENTHLTSVPVTNVEESERACKVQRSNSSVQLSNQARSSSQQQGVSSSRQQGEPSEPQNSSSNPTGTLYQQGYERGYECGWWQDDQKHAPSEVCSDLPASASQGDHGDKFSDWVRGFVTAFPLGQRDGLDCRQWLGDQPLPDFLQQPDNGNAL